MQESNKFENFLVQDYKLPRYMQKDMQANPLNHGTLQLKLMANIYKFCNIERKTPFPHVFVLLHGTSTVKNLNLKETLHSERD